MKQLIEDLEENKKEWDKLIADTYDEFKVFCNNSHLPEYEVFYSDDNEFINYKMQVLSKERPVKLFIDTKYMRKKPEMLIKKVLYHEFTHIYDNLLSNSEILPSYWRLFIKIYTEFHAAQVELAYLLNCTNINDVQSIDYKSKIPHYYNIDTYINEMLVDARYYKKCFVKKNDKENKTVFLSTSFNYLGVVYLCKEYCYDTSYLEEFEEAFRKIAIGLSNYNSNSGFGETMNIIDDIKKVLLRIC